jgi:flagellar biosynthetic protein FliP
MAPATWFLTITASSSTRTLLIDLIVSSVLMSLGMMMVPPVMISLPLKVLMFVLIDGWALIVRSLVGSFH